MILFIRTRHDAVRPVSMKSAAGAGRAVVTAAAVILIRRTRDRRSDGLQKAHGEKRERLFAERLEKAHCTGASAARSKEIESTNILQATFPGDAKGAALRCRCPGLYWWTATKRRLGVPAQAVIKVTWAGAGDQCGVDILAKVMRIAKWRADKQFPHC